MKTKILDHLMSTRICHGVSDDKGGLCTVAAMNFAMTCEVTDDRPDCMSEVIHAWIVYIQDITPLQIINSKEWKLAATDSYGTGMGHERERFTVLSNWIQDVVVPCIMEVSDAKPAAFHIEKFAQEVIWAGESSGRYVHAITRGMKTVVSQGGFIVGDQYWETIDIVHVLKQLNMVGK